MAAFRALLKFYGLSIADLRIPLSGIDVNRNRCMYVCMCFQLNILVPFSPTSMYMCIYYDFVLAVRVSAGDLGCRASRARNRRGSAGPSDPGVWGAGAYGLLYSYSARVHTAIDGYAAEDVLDLRHHYRLYITSTSTMLAIHTLQINSI